MYDALEALEDCLDEEDLDGARAALADAERLGGDSHPEVLYGKACLLWETDGPEAAEALLRQAIEQDPEHADAHYALAAAAEEREDLDTMVAHHLRVLSLDARQD